MQDLILRFNIEIPVKKCFFIENFSEFLYGHRKLYKRLEKSCISFVSEKFLLQ